MCHMGCALRVWLVVTGEEAGHLWRDGRTDDSAILPFLTREAVDFTIRWLYSLSVPDSESHILCECGQVDHRMGEDFTLGNADGETTVGAAWVC
jgi:hypothetical protein